ncbi:23S rRNA (uracil(1939)-C(5))-methyltransferase RlmD [bacterium]|nr:MAG: 23S rRNA (uracil(1939)-C(5))-methyltransferase RlmD [bacterium]
MSETKDIRRQARVEFHGLAAGGEAVGRDEGGKTIFAPFAAPGDVALVGIESEKKSFGRGLIASLEVASPQRITPSCPQFRPATPSESCGGCSWQHVSLEAQRRAKREIVQNALTRIGGQTIEVEECVGGDGFRYRNKGDFVIGRAQGQAELGFFAAASHDLVPAPTCPIQRLENEEILTAAREILQAHPAWGFDAASGRGFWRRLVARVGMNGETLATLVTSREATVECAEIASLLQKRVPHLTGVLERAPKGAARSVWGRDHLMESVNGLEFRVTADAFWQVNSQISPWLVQTALVMAQVQRGQKALDLFCGAGLFALHLAREGAVVTGIETHQGAIKDATFNTGHNGLSAKFRAGDAARELGKFRPGDFDLILLDPPRAGAAECLPALARLAPERLVYVSCDPATLARDAKFLTDNGYELQRAIPFDLFPQTAHVETAALFTRA